MTKRTKRGSIKTDEVLTKLREGRNGAIQVHTEARVNSEEYRVAGEVIQLNLIEPPAKHQNRP